MDKPNEEIKTDNDDLIYSADKPLTFEGEHKNSEELPFASGDMTVEDPASSTLSEETLPLTRESIPSPPEEEEMISIFYRPAGLFTRFLAYLADLVVVVGITNIFLGGNAAVAESESLFTGMNIATLGVLGSFYFLLTTHFFGQTLGKMIMNIEVIGTDGKKPNFLSLIFREVVGRLISQFGGLHLGYIWAAFHPRKKAWHDSIGDTYVVFKNENESEKLIEIREPLTNT